MSADPRMLYARSSNEDSQHRTGHRPSLSSSSSYRSTRSKSSDKTLQPASPRADKNFLVPRTEPPRPGVDPRLQIQHLEASMLLQAAMNRAQHEQHQQQRRQYEIWYPDSSASPPPGALPSRGSKESLYYHPTTTQQAPPMLPHMMAPPIHRPSTAPPQQLRSVLAPPQPPDRYKTPRPRSPFEEFNFPGEFFCKRCQQPLPTKDSFHAHMSLVHKRGPGHLHTRS